MQDNPPDPVAGWQRQLRKGVLEVAVLSLLRARPHYGLELVECLSPLGVRPGSIYPLLARIRREGKVESEWVSDTSGHARKYYALTPAGRRTCEAQLSAWATFRDAFESLVETHDEARAADHG